jgi:hypothetical protein
MFAFDLERYFFPSLAASLAREARRRGCGWRAIELLQSLNGLQSPAFGSSIRLHRTGWK